MIEINKDLYPTSRGLANRMLSLVDWSSVRNILEPSAGMGDLIEAMQDRSRYFQGDVSAIEIDNRCREVLHSKGIKIIDSDFLQYNGLEQFDLIVANFPFSDGDKHLHKAIDILFSGQIVCLINAETIKNDYSNSRKDLIQKLKRLNAKIEFIENAFLDAERKTDVEVALIYINKVQNVETDLFSGTSDSDENFEDVESSKEIATKDDIFNIVARYNKDKDTVLNQIMDFYKNYKNVSRYLDLSVVGEDIARHQTNVRVNEKELTQLMKDKLNYFARTIKREYWLQALQLEEISTKLTSKKRKQLANELNNYTSMDFTVENIKIFIENLKASYPKMIEEAIEDMFDKFTQYAFRDGRNQNNEYSKNIHLFNGWKTNQAYRVDKKVILPFTPDGYNGTVLYSDKRDFFDDIDLVFNYFDSGDLKIKAIEYTEKQTGYKRETKTTSDIVGYWLSQGETKKIDTRYFTVTLYKKGTVHLIFKDLEMLRRFNIFIAKRKGFLPMNYGYTEKRDNRFDFETDKEYEQIGTELCVQTKNILLLK